MAKPPSWNEIHRKALLFSERWKDELSESESAQHFWIEFLDIFGIDKKRVAVFEAQARRTSTGGRGEIDLFWPGLMIAEHKSAGKKLEQAEEQAIDYLNSLEQRDLPRYVVTSNFSHMRILDLIGGESAFEFKLEDLVKEIDRFSFIAGYKARKFSTQLEEKVNIEAARYMARLYEELSRHGSDDHEASILMTRLLFLLFADDSGIWEKGLFEEFIRTRTEPDGSDLGALLANLFQILDRDESKRSSATDELLLRFPYVNGGIFKDRLDIPQFDRHMRDELLECSTFDWSAVSPAIFGSLFQAIKSKEARRTLGEHYTTESNIRRVIDPLLIDGLRAEFEINKHNPKKLEKLRIELGKLRILDPACGCGNFLVIAYRELRRLELDILLQIRELTGIDPLPLDPTHMLMVRLPAFAGIEIEEWPAKIAQTAMFLVDHQANIDLALEFGRTEERLPISESANIINKNALTLDWSEAFTPSDDLVIIGNPPFIGSRMANESQKIDQALVWNGNSRQGTLDFVTNWFKKSAEFIAGTKARVAFVSTNSITQGEQPSVLWTELWKLGMRIDFAHRTFSWSSEAPGAASVHCVIIGFSSRPKPSRLRLWNYVDLKENGIESSVSNITPYLTDGPDIVISSRQEPFDSHTPKMYFGSMPRDAGWLSNISKDEAQEIKLRDPIAAKYLRPIIGAEELINGGERWCLWLVDATPGEIASSSVLKMRLGEVADMRVSSKAKSTREFAKTPGLFAQIAQPKDRYLGVPRVSSETRNFIPVSFHESTVIASDALLTIANADEVLFGLISSSIFTAWAKAVSGRLESRIRISQEITYNNFPWLAIDDSNRQAISSAALKVLSVRDSHPNETLGSLYNPLAMPSDLVAAHSLLDKVVLKAYKIPSSASEPEIVAHLLKRYEALRSQDFLLDFDSVMSKKRKK
jgi:type I restriction-modification system DNA methylase subunit